MPVTAIFLIAIASTVIPVGDRRGILLPLCLALNLTWIFLSGSRGSLFAGVVAGSLFVVNWRAGAAARFAIAAACVVAIATAGAFAPFESGMNERIEKLFAQDRSLSNRTSGRSDIAIVGWQMFRDTPLGVGTGGFMVSAPRYGRIARLDVFRGHAELQAHSAWIKTLGENGFPGVILLTAFICSFTVVGWRRRAHGVLGLGVTVSLVLAIAFLSTEFQAKGLWLFAAAGMMILQRFSRRTPTAPRVFVPVRPPRAVA
jgi:O-antigen ligase